MKKLICALAAALTLLGLLPSPVPAIALSERPIPITFQAFHPGHTSEEGIRDSGEFIELVNLEPHTSLSLAGLSIVYTNKSGNRSNIVQFPEGSVLSGENLLLRLARSPEASQAHSQYNTNISATNGVLELVYQGLTLDKFCWGSLGDSCLANFSKTPLSTIVHHLAEDTYAHQDDYTPTYDPEQSIYTVPAVEEPEIPDPQCRGLQFSELLSYYESDKSEQFIELYNPTDEPIPLSGCALRYKKKDYPLTGTIAAGDYLVRSTDDFTLTKNPTSSNTLELIDANDEIIDTLTYPHGQKKATSYALFGYSSDGSGNWLITYQPTPGAPNLYQEFRSCPAGKVINQATGNCVKSSTLSSTTTDCPAGKYRNPETGRCKSYDTATTAECKAGYERNPETNRCRKIKDNTGASFSLTPQTAEQRTTFVAFGAVAAIVLAGLGYVVFQFRAELRRGLKRLLQHFPRLYRFLQTHRPHLPHLQSPLARLRKKRSRHGKSHS